MIRTYNRSRIYYCLFSVMCIFTLLQFACNEDKLPILKTAKVTDVTYNSAVCGGEISDDGGSAITDRGVCWNKVGNPVFSDNKTSDGEGIGVFTSIVTSLTPNTSYYIRAYAMNESGIFYGDEINFVTDPLIISDSYTDKRDGKTYKIVKIGEQWWMAENLAYLPQVSPATSSSYTKAMYYVNNYLGNDVSKAKSSTDYQKYGVLYNWLAAKEACPDGWHLPSLTEWNQLITYIIKMENTKEEKVGYYLRSKEGWFNNENGVDRYGFTALPGGSIISGVCYSLTTSGNWWTSTMDQTTKYVWYYEIYYLGDNNSSILNNSVSLAFSVRCIKD